MDSGRLAATRATTLPLSRLTSAARRLISILDSVEVPIVVVRRDCRIAGFNEAAADVLDLSASDVGRAFRDVAVLAGLLRLEEQCGQVITSGLESRADFRDRDKWFVVRISPYARSDRRINGAVLTFTNVTAFRASTDQAIYEREFTKTILNTVTDPIVVLGDDRGSSRAIAPSTPCSGSLAMSRKGLHSTNSAMAPLTLPRCGSNSRKCSTGGSYVPGG